MSARDPEQAPAPGARAALTWRRYLRFWGARPGADVDDELQFHLDMRTRDYLARGMSESEARTAALHRLGDLRRSRAESVSITSRRERRMNRTLLVHAFVQDLRFAVRTLARRKGWTAVAVLTLALAIGANTAVFTVVDALLLHPIPYPHADRIAVIMQQPSQANTTGTQVALMPVAKLVKAWREDSRSFEDVQGYVTTDKMLDVHAAPAEVVHTAAIDPSFPRFAGQKPLFGRGFDSNDVQTGGHVALLGEATWRSKFGADPAVLGRVVTLDGESYTVIGVMPVAFQIPRLNGAQADVWLPLDMSRSDIGLNVLGRLRKGVTQSAAATELDSIAARTATSGSPRLPFHTVLLSPWRMVGFHEMLLMLSAAVVLVLLIACANVAHLLLASAATRERELAIRVSLGAGTSRLFRQMLTESLVLSAAGCAAGVFVGWVALRALLVMRPARMVELDVVHTSGSTLAFTAMLCLVTGIVFGIVGVVQAARHSTHEALKAGATSTSAGKRQRRLRSLLVVNEMALSTVLLVGAMLLVRTVMHLQHVEPGFEPEGLYSMSLSLPQITDTAQLSSRRAVIADAVERARHIPGVRAVTTAAGAPPFRSFTLGALEVEGDPPPPPDASGFLANVTAEPNFFAVMGMRFHEGHTFTDTSRSSSQVIVNEGFARKHWGLASALGRRVRVRFPGNAPPPWLTIVGVVRDAATGGLTSDATDPMLYFPPVDHVEAQVMVRVAPGAKPLPTLRQLGMQVTPHGTPPSVTSISDMMHQSLAGPRFTMTLLVVFTGLAVVLAAIGLYGVLAYTVAQRTREIGIRLALGASRRRIARSVALDGVALAAVGIAIGLAAALWATKLVQSMLHGVDRTDPLSFALGGMALLATAVVACLVPIRRAVRVDPAIAMRAE